MKYAPLNELCTIQSGGTPSRSNTNYWNSPEIPWVKISDIKGKHITETEEYISNEGLSNSSAKIFPSGTILYTIFATLGEVGILDIDAATNQAIAGLTITSNKIKRDYLYYYLQSIKRQVTNMGRGVAQNNINIGILKQLEVPLYPPNIQSEIVCKLTYVEQLMSNRKQALTTLDTLVKSRFIEMFGDPVTNDMNWKTDILKNLGELNRGVSKHRPRNAPELLGGPYPLVQTGDVSNADTYINDYSSTYSEIGLKQSRMWSKGTLCITIAANIAQTGILTFDACFPDSVVGFISGSRTNQMYMHYWFSFFQKILEEQAPQSAQKNINLQILSNLSVMVPPLELQEQFAKFVELTDKSKLAVQQSIDTLQTLKDKLMQDYFG